MMTYIRYLDSLYDKHWENFFIKCCGIDFEYYWFHKEVLTRDILDSNIDDLVDKMFNFLDFVSNPQIRPRTPLSGDGYWITSMDDIYIGFQILGILILQTGGYLPIEVKDMILYSTTWKYDIRREWAVDFIDERKECLKKFRDIINNYREGQNIVIDF